MNYKVYLNMIANVLSFGVSLIISFFLTPYITGNVGIEAYGLIGLANSFTGYITIITSALNSMASRFIIIELHKNRHEKANVYFSSVLIVNFVFAMCLLIPSICLVLNIDILNISKSLLFDARITFVLIFTNFIIGLIGSFYSIVLYTKNMLWKGSFRTLEANLIRVAVIVLLFYLLKPKVYFVVIATLICTLYPLFFNVFYTKKYLPELKVKLSCLSFKAIKELITSGIWNSITKLSQILLDGLDLLLSNIFVSGEMTGNVSISKTIPALFTSMVAILSDSFYPKMLEEYSKNKIKELIETIKFSIKVLSSISGICLSMLMVYSVDFYKLWIPSADAYLLSKLTILATGTVLISGCIYSLFSVFSLTNKVKTNSLVLLFTGVLSTATTFLCLKYTNLGVFAIVGVSSIFGIIRNLVFTPVYAAKCLNISKMTFYPVLLKNLLNVVVLIVVENVIKHFIVPSSWGMLVVNGLISVVIGILITVLLMYSKDEKKLLFSKVMRKI